MPGNHPLIAVTNILEFTTWNTRDVIVTDEYCFRRFFGTAKVEILGNQKSLGVLDRIRLSEKPNAKELIKYLENPPQVERVRKSLNSTSISLPIIGDSGPKISMAHFTYNPKKDKRISRLLGKKSKKKRRRRRSSKSRK